MVWYFKAFALTGRQICDRNYPGRCPGLGASALSGRVGQNLRISLTQVAQSAYSSGSIRLPKWLSQLTQVAQSDYSSGSIRLLKWLNQTTQVAQSASTAVCVSEYSRLRNPVQPYPYPSSATSVGKRKYIVCLPHLSAQ